MSIKTNFQERIYGVMFNGGGGGGDVNKLLKTFLPIGLKAESLAQSDGNNTLDGSTPIPDERWLIFLDKAYLEL